MSLLGIQREQSRLVFKKPLVVSATRGFAFGEKILLRVILFVKQKLLLAVIYFLPYDAAHG
jgi:hypothetical protein